VNHQSKSEVSSKEGEKAVGSDLDNGRM